MADATPLLLLPGTLCDERVYRPALEGLAVDAVPVALEGADTIPDMARLILATAPPRFGLLGFSLGAMMALEIIATAPERVTRLALIGANAGTLPPERAEARRAAWREALVKGPGHFVDLTWDAAIPVHSRADQSLRQALHAMARDTSPEAFRAQVEMAINRRDLRPLLKSITVPTLVMVGAEDHVCPPALAREIADAVPGSRLEIIEGAGHYASLDQPGRVRAALKRWLDLPAPQQA